MSPQLVLILVSLIVAVLAKVPPCCRNINNAPCRRYCEQMVEMSTSIQQMQQLLTAAEECPRDLESFWSCLNSSLPVVLESKLWPGRPCCDLALNAQCRRRCQNAHSKSEVRRSCMAAEEKSLFTCLRKQEEGETCCRQSTSLSCGMVCRSLYLASNPRNSRSSRVLTQHCGGPGGTPVRDCVQRQSPAHRTSNSSENLHCCELAKERTCKDTCIRALRSSMSEMDIMEEMTVDCGSPNLIEPLWTCFLRAQPSNNNNTPLAARMDNAALQCCAKAVTSRCRTLCTQTFKSGWSYHSEFYKSCSYIQPVSTIEASMHKCLKDVEEPCQPGCSGLSFCSTFNDRPAELFRTCTRDADQAAEKAFKEWEKGLIRISLPQMTIPVKDVRRCEPDKWKAIACALQIKPCLKQPSLLSLCKEDCIDILNKCVDRSRLGSEQSVPQLCNALPSVKTPGACVSLAHHLRASPYSQQEGEITHPCKPNPCRGDEVCEIRRRRCKHPQGCKQFICKSACSLGQMSSMSVATGTFVRIPDPARSNERKDCYLGCRCDSKGQMEHCRPLPCLQRRDCMLGAGNKQEHGSHFLLDKSQCICHDGNLLCSRQTCLANSSPAHLTGSSSDCSTQYKPVCGANGKTYPNSCYARCAGVTRMVSATSCSQYDPCQDFPCGPGQRCVVRRQVCLGRDAQHNCPQYECVSKEGLCNSHNHDAVCDTVGEEFTNACLLFSHHRSLAYRGHCQVQQSCNLAGPVCGHDGETYSSQCAARAASITVDYEGACRAIGNLTVSSMKMVPGRHTISCARVHCPALRPSHCRGVVPPGACCPICAAQLRALFSPALVDVASDRMAQGPLTVQRMVRALSRLLTVAQCDVFGYLSLDGDLVLLVAPLALSPSDVQVEACNSEAERLEMLISHGSPTLTLYLQLSPLLLAPAQLARLNYNVPMYRVRSAAGPSAALPGTQTWPLLCAALLLTLLLHWHRKH
ncbi:reversion-inducing cysteine-rich protein with Kazal motifs-like [Babylonia areolata]|uniref:reversion-inducing cysteine-rich protein with Kazal motifs-like n=1 Tax=Babylonia areolata TaxID=304850 RepID=UPI003FD022D8